MEPAGAAAPPAGRGRVVMLVDNGVHGDSRVQKVARSAADAGWEVTLLGRSPGAPQSWRLGRAEVRLLRMPDPLTHASVLRRAAARVLDRRGAAVPAPAPAPAPPAAAAAQPAAAAGPPVARGRSSRASRRAALRRAYRPWDRSRTWFWTRVKGDAAWRRIEPSLWDFEDAYGPVIDELAPDLIHAHDFVMLGVGARAKQRAADAGRTMRLVWDAHEFLPGLKPRRDDARWLPAHRAYEREYAPAADAVVTVSEALADLLVAEHGLRTPPVVVLNAPAADHGPDATDESVPDLRALCGLDAGTPLLVYSGAAAPQRGLATMVRALPELPGVHVALVVNQAGMPYVRGLLSQVGDEAAARVHVLPYVSHWHVVAFLAAADAGVIPIQHWPNHEIALITKFFEYAQARLPIVVSDVRAMAAAVHETGQGEVFRADDLEDYVRAARAVLADPGRYRAAYDRPGLLAAWTWEAQAGVLAQLYRGLLRDPDPADRIAA
jgi:glycogen(starch) synthase